MIRVTGLWQNVSKKGDKYLSGKMGGIKVLIFKNGFKEENSKQPDFYVYIAGDKKDKESSVDDVNDNDK